MPGAGPAILRFLVEQRILTAAVPGLRFFGRKRWIRFCRLDMNDPTNSAGGIDLRCTLES